MNNFNIRYWDDNVVSRSRIQAPLIDLQRQYPYITFSEIKYMELLNAETAKTVCEDIDLLILDLLNEQELMDNERPETVGIFVISNLRSLKIDIPIIVYSDAVDEKNAEISFLGLQKEFPNVVFIKKSDDKTASILKHEISKVIVNNLPDQFTVDQDYSDEFNQQLILFGRRELNELLSRVKENFSIETSEKLHLKKMTSGFSGAILFDFKHDNTDYIIKVSKDISLLDSEFIKSKSLYGKFPSKFFNQILHEKIITSSSSAIGIVIKLIPNSQTLFEFILSSPSCKEIEDIFKAIYFNEGLKEHYGSQVYLKKEKWTVIFDKFKNGKFIKINNVYKDLKPLLTLFKINEVKSFVEDNFYNKLNDKIPINDGAVLLNHLDLHSRNILVQANQTPFLIDTGVMDYGYWAFDIARLIVDLYINGIDFKNRDFFDINCIQKNILLGKKLISLEQADYDGENDRILDSLNWLTSNVENIYGGHFIKWELQFSFMKEFLQMSYRVESIPHSKRALSLELAQICMEEGYKTYFEKQDILS